MCSIPKRSGSRNTLGENLLYLSSTREEDEGAGWLVGLGRKWTKDENRLQSMDGCGSLPIRAN